MMSLCQKLGNEIIGNAQHYQQYQFALTLIDENVQNQ
jgi:hypothetical protein